MTKKITILGMKFNVVEPGKKIMASKEVEIKGETHEIEIPNDFWSSKYKPSVRLEKIYGLESTETKTLDFKIGNACKFFEFTVTVTYNHEKDELEGIYLSGAKRLGYFEDTIPEKKQKELREKLAQELKNHDNQESWFNGVKECETCSNYFISEINNRTYKNCSNCEDNEVICTICPREVEYDDDDEYFPSLCKMHETFESGEGGCEGCEDGLDEDLWDENKESFTSEFCKNCTQEEENSFVCYGCEENYYQSDLGGKIYEKSERGRVSYCYSCYDANK